MSILPLITIMPEVLELNQAEIRALLDLIEFHDDWDEVSERTSDISGTNVRFVDDGLPLTRSRKSGVHLYPTTLKLY